MLQNESVVLVVDNTWAKKAKIIRILKWSNAKSAWIWDLVKVSIKSASPTGSVKKWEVYTAMIVRVKKEYSRKDGTYIRFEDNAIILLSKNDKWEIAPIWKRIFWPVAKEIRELWHKNIVNMAEDIA